MPGRNWTPGTESFLVRPDEYAAATFHEDDLSDAGWETSLSFRVPPEWRSGAYGSGCGPAMTRTWCR